MAPLRLQGRSCMQLSKQVQPHPSSSQLGRETEQGVPSKSEKNRRMFSPFAKTQNPFAMTALSQKQPAEIQLTPQHPVPHVPSSKFGIVIPRLAAHHIKSRTATSTSHSSSRLPVRRAQCLRTSRLRRSPTGRPLLAGLSRPRRHQLASRCQLVRRLLLAEPEQKAVGSVARPEQRCWSLSKQ